MTKEDMKRYRYGTLAVSLLESGDFRSVQESLNLLAGDLGIEDEAEGFISGAMASEQGIQTATSVYAKKRNKALETSTVEDITGYFGEYIDYAKPEDAKKIREALGKYKETTFGDINKEYEKAQYILKGKDKYEFKPEEIKDSEKVVEKYKTLLQVIGTVEQAEMDNLLPKVKKKVHTKSLEEIAKKL